MRPVRFTCALMAVCLFAAPAAAQTPAKGAPAPEPAAKVSIDAATVLGQIDADAALVVVARARGAKAVLEWLQKFGGMPGMSIDEFLKDVGTESARVFGVDLANPVTWTESGLDLDAPIGMGFVAIDTAAAQKAYKALTAGAKRDAKTLAKVARPWYRNRIVIPLADVEKFTKLLGHMTGNSSVALVDGDVARLAKAAGVDEKQGAAVAKALKKAKVTAFGHIEEAFLFVRVEKGTAIVDALIPFADDMVPFDWKRDSGAMLKLLGRKIGKGGASTALASPAGASLADADLGMWTEPGRLLDSGKATGWHRSLEATAGMDDAARWKELVAEGDKEVARCEDFRPIAQTGPFTDFAWTFKAEPKAFTTGATWGLRKAFALAAALVAADDGLVDLAAASDAVAIGALYLNGLAPIRALPRTGVFAKSMQDVGESLMLCGWAGNLTAFLFAWPQLMALEIEEESARDPQFKSLADNVRNGAAAFRQISMDFNNSVGVALASFTTSPDLSWIESVGGKSSVVKVGQREVTLFAPRSKWEPAILKTTLDASKIAYGVVMGGNAAVKWFWGKGSPTATAAAGVLGVGRADMAKIFEQLGKEQPMMAPIFTELAKRMGLLSAKLSIDGGLLTGAMKLDIK
jgi:hypothetical protein